MKNAWWKMPNEKYPGILFHEKWYTKTLGEKCLTKKADEIGLMKWGSWNEAHEKGQITTVHRRRPIFIGHF